MHQDAFGASGGLQIGPAREKVGLADAIVVMAGCDGRLSATNDQSALPCASVSRGTTDVHQFAATRNFADDE